MNTTSEATKKQKIFIYVVGILFFAGLIATGLIAFNG